MLYSIYKVLAAGMKYWFLCLAVLIVMLLISVSKKEYRERRAVLGEIGQYVGYLEIVGGLPEAQGMRIGVARDNTIGSGRSADIVIRHSSVQRAHALLYMQNGKLILSPLAKGITQINGRQANQAYAVHTGDVISFGRVETRVFIRPELEQTI